MSLTVYQKLIRDNIPQFFAKPNKIFNTKILSNSEFKIALKQKLIEESQELLKSDNRNDLINELADVIEVLNYIKSSENISEAEVEAIRLQKKQQRGGFDKKLFLESIEEK
ncbi:MAG TPA: nucleoside triphosphate pyrophosphohydrolase [Candidatus Woesebacteria bacterium]|jgi:predicted house-cleaning noncanonical NTP pyrophosphatase (MazG superfamily)|nr:nucleoside triphosphate pyrophosphohydrolase [Candidatus Shapirobacteria bacterium]HOR02238.1 nucleoside triphosphate pyrophosphohydrolase [Candidatus Woesebacteria bacterium]